MDRDNEEEGGEEQRASDEPVDDLGQVISDAKRDCETEKDKLKLQGMLEDHKKIVVPKLRRWQHEARYHTGIAAMEGREWYN